MRIVMEELIGEENFDLTAETGQKYFSTGQAYFDAWLAVVQRLRAEQDDAYLQEHMPKTWMLLEMADPITSG